jgi:acyl-CoA synthetase (AMP-forming)/AMP-acid ligase II
VNVGLLLSRSAQRFPDRLAAFEGERGLTYAQLDERSSRVANLLQGAFRIGRGDRVALLVRNRLEVAEVLAGTAKAGGVYVGLNFRLGRAEYDAVFENAQPRVLLSELEFEPLARELADTFELPLLFVDDDGDEGYEAMLATASPREPSTLHDVRAEDDFCILYSSGTTGLPKGILFDHGAVLTHAAVVLLEYEYGRDTRFLMMIPHNSSVQITTVPSLMMGSTIGFADARSFDPEWFAAEVERRAATHSFLVPTQLFRLLEHVRDSRPLRTLETLCYGSSPIAPDRVRELVERFGPIFLQLYGMAEVASIGTMLRKDDHVAGLERDPRLLASAGRPSYLLDVRVVDDDRRDVPNGSRGEVIFGGPYILRGYFRDPVRTAEALVDGWVHSGDIGEFDEEGYLYIVDRKKDLIIRGGLNIAPTEIENVLYRHDAVLEAAVIGVPDAEWGESVHAFIALKNDKFVDAADLERWCRSEGLPTIKVPAAFSFVESLPKNAVGKIAKRELRDGFWSGRRNV